METVAAFDYHDLVRVSEPRISPDGERVAFVRTVSKGERDDEATIHAVALGGGEPRRLTLAEGVDSEPRWSPDGERIARETTATPSTTRYRKRSNAATRGCRLPGRRGPTETGANPETETESAINAACRTPKTVAGLPRP